jgi:hypothetical protein
MTRMTFARASLVASLVVLAAACGQGPQSNANGGPDAGGSAGPGGGGGSMTELCHNGVDDDGDTHVDCADTECFQASGCFASCVDLCFPGSTLCDGAGVRTCELLADGCYGLGVAQPCDASLVCTAGACADTCTDVCTEGAKACSGGAVVRCVKLQSGCTEWVEPTACAQGEVCNAGACVPKGTCTNQCAEAATQCTATGQQQSCVKASSGCTEWALPQACPGDQTCPNSGSACTLVPCTPGATRCKGTSVETCDAQSNWIVTQSCPQACQAGQCTLSVTCTPGAVRCNAKAVEICNSSGTAWLYNQTCNVGCTGGVCTDPCTAGDKRCNGNTPEVCNQNGSGWTATQTCATSCFKGDCTQADLVIDGVTQTLEGDLVLQNSLVVRNGGQLVVGPSGQLRIRAKTVSVDGASSIVANAVGDETRGSGKNKQACCTPNSCGQVCSSIDLPSVYGTSKSQQVENYSYCSYYSNHYCYATVTAAAYDRDDDLSISEGSAHGSDLGGGMVSIVAQSVTLDGDVTANGSGQAAGGGILVAADELKGAKVLQAAGGPGGGGDGRVKLLRGVSNGFTGTVVGKKAESVMPPLELVSGSHPDPERWYNDGVGDLVIAWSRPFPTVNGYYYRVSTSAGTLPSPSNGTFMQAELHSIPAKDLQQGPNYFHIISVDSAFNFGTVKNTFVAHVNTQPPTVSSQSHQEGVWTTNNAPYLTWQNPQDDANFTGYYYVLDHYADSVPTAAAGTFTTNKQLLLSNLQPGIWVFHIVNRDTRNATTKAAGHFKLYVGNEPQKGNLSGSVFDASNNNAPLADVTLKINRGLFTATTASNGTYTFNNNAYEGAWEVTATAQGYEPQTKTVTVTAGQTVNLNFTLSKDP